MYFCHCHKGNFAHPLLSRAAWFQLRQPLVGFISHEPKPCGDKRKKKKTGTKLQVKPTSRKPVWNQIKWASNVSKESKQLILSLKKKKLIEITFSCLLLSPLATANLKYKWQFLASLAGLKMPKRQPKMHPYGNERWDQWHSRFLASHPPASSCQL